jgi:hypothetical protein
MRTAIGIALIAGALSLLGGAQEIKAVFERDSEIFVMRGDGSVSQITHDGAPKTMPLWSKDGNRIAYLQGVEKNRGLGELVVIRSSDGRPLFNVAIRPPKEDEGQDIRYIDRLEWLTAEKVAVSGSINPSTEESLVVDLSSGRELVNYYDDTGGAVFSPDGEHVVFIDGAPHFMPEKETVPAINVDLRRMYPREGVRVDFLSKAEWSADSKTVAIVARNRESRRTSLLRCIVGSSCVESELPLEVAAENYSLNWAGEDISVRSPEGASTLGSGGDLIRSQMRVRSNSSIPPDPKLQAAAMADGLRRKVRDLGGSSEDFWCAGCVISSLPRKTGAY